VSYVENMPVGPTGAAEGQSCARHPGAAAVVTCKRCGDYACVECVGPGESALCVPCAELVGGPRYHAVPPWRFFVYSLLSFGLYEVYWAYRCWANIKARGRPDIWPLPRAIFLSFTSFGLVTDLNEQRVLRGLPLVGAVWPGIYLLLSLVLRVLDKVAEYSENPAVDAFYWLLFLPHTAILLPVLRGMREVTSRAELDARDALRTRHVLAFVVLGLFVTLALVGTFMPEI
jgi:hypothetical protein